MNTVKEEALLGKNNATDSKFGVKLKTKLWTLKLMKVCVREDFFMSISAALKFCQCK